MLEKLRQIENRYSELESKLADPAYYSDPAVFTKLCREQRELQPVVEAYRAYAACQAQTAQAEALLDDPELHEIAREEIEQGRVRCTELEQQLRVLLLPRDPNDDRNVILEIRTGVGGEESALFAHSLYRMYNMYADAHGWKTEIANLNETELGGVREASLLISGQGAYSRLKFESGVHRVQRVPETETGGRTPAPPPWPCCRRWTPWRCTSTRRICRSTPTAAPAPAASTSTRPRAPSASRTCRPARSSSVRMSAASIKTRIAR